MSRAETLRRNLEKIVRVDAVEGRATVLDEPGALCEPVTVRKALAFARLLRDSPVHIYPGELIVGMPLRERPSTEDPSVRLMPPERVTGQGYIEYSRGLVEGGNGDAAYYPVLGSLRGGVASTTYALFPHYATREELDEAGVLGLDENSNPGHLQGGNARVIALGWTGLREMALAQLGAVDASTPAGRRQEAFLRSVVICLEAAMVFALRYSRLASGMAGEEPDEARRRELLRVSEVCRLCTERAPGSWWEALQLHWFTHMLDHAQGAHQSGRFDQYMWPPLRRDLESGAVTEAEARELLECLWVKYSSYTDYTSDNLQNIVLGGLTPDGVDGTNPLSFMCMEATDRLGVIDPKWSIRVHGSSPEEFLRAAARVIKRGRSQPGIYNDEAIIGALVRAGVPLGDARDYTNDGCSEILVQGRSNPWCFEGKVLLLKCLERAAWRLEEYGSYDELWAALLREVDVAVSMAVSGTNLLQGATPRISPNPWLSASVEGCVEKRLDLTEGGATYNFSSIDATGVADAADSLAAIRKLVYEEKRISKRELVEALSANFVGYERLRQMLLNRAPKFGNDDDYVDGTAAALVEHVASEVTRYRNPRGGTYTLGLFSYGEYIGHGLVTGATPDGRRAGEGISPNFSPAPGRDRKGPFAAMRSTCKVDQSLAANGTALDLTLHPSALMGEEGTEKLVSLLRAFNRLGGMQVQLNIVDGATLRAAQANPEKYRGLTVRLWGLPAYFTRLPREFQDHLIARTENQL